MFSTIRGREASAIIKGNLKRKEEKKKINKKEEGNLSREREMVQNLRSKSSRRARYDRDTTISEIVRGVTT